jgi:energy-coupling factor transport system permease protein
MSLSTNLYVPRQSWLHKLDARVKLWAALVGIVLCFVVARLPFLAGLYILTALILRSGGIPLRRVLAIVQSLLPFTILILLLQPWFFATGQTLLQIGPLRLTTDGLLGAALLAMRANTLALLALMPLLTTPEDKVIRGMVKLGLPYRLGFTITLALRYLPNTAALFTTVRQAQEARGFEVGAGRLWARARSFFPVLIAVIITSIRLSDQLTLSMTVRGLGAGPRTTWRDIQMRPVDWIAAGVVGLAAAGVWIAVH